MFAETATSVADESHTTSTGVRFLPRSGDLAAQLLFAAFVAMFVDGVLWCWLYLRPSPFGRPFALDPAHYVFHAIYYAMWAQALVVLPFLALSRFVRAARWPLFLYLGLATTLLLVGAVDRECQRFMGMHATLGWIRSYAAVTHTPDVIWQTLKQDHGGSWSSLFALAFIAGFPVVGSLRPPRWIDLLRERRVVYSLLLLLLALPTAFWNWIPGGGLRRSKVKPALMLVLHEVQRSEAKPPSPEQLAAAVQLVQTHHAETSAAPGWQFVDPNYPLLKHFAGVRPTTPAVQPNFVVLSLETFRARDMASMNPKLQGTPPTPFLDALARSPQSAYFNRYYTTGVPTVYAFMSIHTSLLQHPTRSIPAEATTDNLESFPSKLRQHGYYTMHFTGSDPDWDSQRVWLDRWYDEVQYHAEDGERDRLTFRRAAQRVREVGRSGKPFLLYIASISNHTPFHTPEPERAITSGGNAIDALHNTMHYTDDVVRELYESVRHEPWFANTIWIITGDHAFDLGDRGESGGHDNLRHETTWVPLIIHGSDARLPRGLQRAVGSHVDLAPTIVELANVWDDNAFMGHSLLHAKPDSAEALILRGKHFARETAQHSLFAPHQGAISLYDGADLLQERELKTPDNAFLKDSVALVDATRIVVAHAIDNDRVVPRPAPKNLALASPQQ